MADGQPRWSRTAPSPSRAANPQSLLQWWQWIRPAPNPGSSRSKPKIQRRFAFRWCTSLEGSPVARGHPSAHPVSLVAQSGENRIRDSDDRPAAVNLARDGDRRWSWPVQQKPYPGGLGRQAAVSLSPRRR